jgi:CBS domain-containing protein
MYSTTLSQNIDSISERNCVYIDEDTIAAKAAKVMQDKHTSCVLVTGKNSKGLIGIVTERDIYCIV